MSGLEKFRAAFGLKYRNAKRVAQENIRAVRGQSKKRGT